MRKYVVIYNGKAMADFIHLKSAINFCKRKGYKSDKDNVAYIVSKEGECYDTKGKTINADEL